MRPTEVLGRFKQVDFVKYAYPSYSQPGQFKNTIHFLLENMMLLIYFMIQIMKQTSKIFTNDARNGSVSCQKINLMT